MPKAKSGYKLVKPFFGKHEEIPEDWDFRPLSTMTKKITKGIFDLGPEYYVDDGIPYIRISEIKNNMIDFKSGKFISVEKNKEFPTTELHPGDIVLSKLGTKRFSKQIAIIPNSIPRCNLSQSLIGIKLDLKQIESLFLLYFLQYKKTSNYLILRSTGTIQKWIRLDVMRNLNVPLPKLDEQEKITSILSSVDTLVESYDRIIKTTTKLKQGLMQQLLTKGIGHKKFKKVNLGVRSQEISIPISWEVRKLNEISEHITKGATPTTYGYEWSDNPDDVLFIRNECIKVNRFQLKGSLRITKEANASMSRSKIKPGDLLISITGEIGKTCLFPNNYGEANINQHIARIRINSKDLISKYILNILNSEKLMTYFYTIDQGLTHPHLSLNQIQNTVIPIPPRKEQEKITEILDNYNSKIMYLESKKSTLESFKKGLIQKLLTGQIRVKF